jgi:hypothetical protein
MNIRPAAFLALLWLFALTACVSTQRLEVAPDSAIKPVNEGGGPTLRSRQRYEVIVRPLTDSFTLQTARFPAFMVAVVNRANARVNLSPANITARSGTRDVEVYGFESYRNRVHLEGLLNASGKEDDTAYGGLGAVEKANASSSPILDLKSPVDVNGQMLTSYFIPPGQFAGGVVRLHAISIRRGQPLVIQVSLEGEVHEFHFAVHR